MELLWTMDKLKYAVERKKVSSLTGNVSAQYLISHRSVSPQCLSVSTFRSKHRKHYAAVSDSIRHKLYEKVFKDVTSPWFNLVRPERGSLLHFEFV